MPADARPTRPYAERTMRRRTERYFRPIAARVVGAYGRVCRQPGGLCGDRVGNRPTPPRDGDAKPGIFPTSLGKTARLPGTASQALLKVDFDGAAAANSLGRPRARV